MVTFIPPYMGEEIKSNAERKMYDILQNLNLKNAYILHSLGLPKHQTKIYGEIDFVIVCEYGVACLEIKGGRVICQNGKWFFIDRYGVKRYKPESPFAQVTGNMFSLRENLKKKFKNNPPMKNTLIACGVVFPDIKFDSYSQEVIPEIIYDKGTPDITEYMKRMFGYWKSKQHKPVRELSLSDIKEIVNYLRCDFSFIPTLGEQLDDVEKHLIRLTAEQVQLMDALSLNERLLIAGNAGSGKTLLAVDYAKKQADKGKKVLYLTYNKNLSNHVACQVDKADHLKIINIHALFGDYIKVNTDEMNKNPQKYFAEVLPEEFFEYLKSLSLEDLTELQYDLIVMDEGQDILSPIYMNSLDLLLKGGFENGQWAVFYDEKQNIYNPRYQDGMNILLSYPCTRFRLHVNCRNTIQIGTCSSRMSGVESNDFIRENGEEVQKISYSDVSDFKKQVWDILKQLKTEKIPMNEVTFLAPKKYENSKLHDAGIEVNELGYKFDASTDLPVYATIQGFKGLDSKVVILFDVEGIRPVLFSKFLYIAITRARTLLYIVGSGEFWDTYGDFLQSD